MCKDVKTTVGERASEAMHDGCALRPDGVIFDLDGTLWDETAVTERAWVEVLARHPKVKSELPLDREHVRRYMGLTNEELAEVFFPSLPFEEAFSLMRESCEIENRLLPVCGGTLYDGVGETLCELRERGYRLFIVSNCQDGYIEAFLCAHGFGELFEDIECSGRTGMTKARNLQLVMERNGLRRAILVGDTISDGAAAREVGIPFVYALYGFGEQCGRGRTSDYDIGIGTFKALRYVLG